jgi:amino acid adenylation domain-containing protein
MPTFKNIHSLVEARALQHPDRQAVLHGKQSLSYAQLNEQANALAYQLSQNKGVKNGYVGVCLDRSCDLMVAILGILKAGAAYVPFDIDYPMERLQYMAEVSQISVMVSSPSLEKRLPQSKFQVVDIQSISNSKEVKNLDLDIAKDQAAYVLFTSGSTGQPKGVQMPHKALMNLIDWQLRQTGVHDNGRTLQFAPISFDVHFQEIFSTWSDGGCICLIGDEERLNAPVLLNYLEEKSINRIFLPFVALQSLCELSKKTNADLSSLHEVITAGEQLQVTPAIIDFFNRIPHCKLYNHYGPTETHVVTSYLLEGAPSTWPLLPAIGKVIQHSEIYILDENGKPVKDGDEGELFASGLCLADGYLNRHDLTKERFISHPTKPSERIYKTGDLVKKLPDGNIQYLGRIDGQVKVRGYRIELGEIEVALSRFKKVVQAAATVREDKPGEKKLVAYLVLEKGHELNVKEVRTFLSSLLPDYMMPSAIVQLEDLPRTPSGKIDRKSLPAPNTKRPELGIPFVSPETEIQKILSELWSGLLNIDPIGINDNFFDLGGNSLLALQSVALLKIEYAIDLSVIKLYQYPTVAALAASVEGKENSKSLKKDMEARAKARHQKGTQSVQDAIAVIGMSLRFPGAETVDEFWNNLKNGVESIQFFTPQELDPSIPEDVVTDPNYVRARGIIKNAKGFDAAFFQMNPNVAKVTDPQQRVLLELAWNALEHSGYSPNRYKGLIGVFAGMGNSTYYLNNVLPNQDAVRRVGAFLAMTQNEKDYIATRIAYELNLKGLAVSVHTACSTSLTAIAQACNSLWNRECDIVLAGGSAITSPINSGQRYEEGAMYSNDGHTRTFDQGARGTVFSDGAGMVVLKRYEDAIADGDTVYAVVRGVALNNDGSDKGSFTAPSVDGQSAVISMAQAMAGVDASSISYVETHGTATPLGDPIEIEGLTKAFREHTDKKQYCAIGSVKTNFGHLTAAAGVAGFIKTVLALHHKEIPRNLFYEKANSQIDFANTPFFVNDKHNAWNTDLLPRRAGISSFGVGGTNAHVILEEAPQTAPSGISRSKQLIALSAKTENALAVRKDELKEYLKVHTTLSLADLSYTLQKGRYDFPHRWFAAVESNEDAIQQLEQSDNKRSAKFHFTQKANGVVFMFPGQGSQYVGMGTALYRDEIIFKEAVDRCNEILEPILGRDLRTLLLAKEGDEDAEKLLKQTYYTQPALFTIGYSLAQLWMSWGIQPKALIGHSIGEFVAATIAGVFTLEDALTVVANRGKMMQSCPEGGMLSVRLPEEAILPLLNEKISIAAVNGPQLCVVAGPHEELAKLQQKWEAEEVVCKLLHTSHAFHSPMMDPIVEPFAAIVRTAKLSAPALPILSTVTKKWMTDAEATDPMYWANHLRAAVRFAEGVKAIWTDEPRYIMLELGPRNTASTLARQQSADPKSQKAIPSLGDNAVNDAEWTNMISAIGQLWLNGISIDHNAFYALEKRHRIALPGYPFEHKEFWLDPPLQVRSNQFQENIEYITPETITTQLSSAMPQRKERLIQEISEILEEASGIELEGADRDAGFVELGLDSLFLTQIALTLTKKYNTKVTFRQLNEDLSSLNTLSDFLDAQLPKEAAMPAPNSTSPQRQTSMQQPSVQMPTSNPTINAGGGNLQWLIQQQLQVMQQQLQMMSGQVQMPNFPTSSIPDAVSKANATTSPNETPFVSPDEEIELKKPFGAVARIEKSTNNQFTIDQQKWLSAFIKAYNERTKKSKEYTQEHRAHLADPRVVTGFKPHLKEVTYQPVVNRSLGSKIWDIDGNEYLDVLNGFGSNMFGHNPPFIVEALQKQLHNGYELGPQHELAGEVAKMICELTDYDRAGFCNTGSEAVLGALRIARTVTGRSLIICFNGSYHGINDEVILRGTKKLKSVPAAAGIMPESVQNMLVLDYGTQEALTIIKERAHEIAAVLVEPVQSRRADFHPKEFLQEVRKITTEGGSLLIFDEVITGFRTLPGGAQQYFDVKADVGTYGKVVGGGMPIGVIAGKREYMDALDGGHWQYGDKSVPEIGVTYFAGTFVRHPFALAAAKAVLLRMKEKGQALQDTLSKNTTRLSNEINAYCTHLKTNFHIVHFGSLFKPKYDADMHNIDLLFLILRHKGIHIYDGFPCFLTEAHTPEDIDTIIHKFKEALLEIVELGFIPGDTNGQSVNGKSSIGKNPFNSSNPPIPGAMLGKNPDGSPGWFVPDPARPGKYLKLNNN